MLKPGEVHVREILPGTDKWDRGYRALATYRTKGKLKTKYFASMRQAHLWAKQWKDQVAASGITSTVTADELAAVMQSRAEIAELDATLAEVIAAGLAVVRARAKGVTVTTLVGRRLDYMRLRGGSKEHLANTTARLRDFQTAFGKRPAALITTAEIDAWLSGLSVGPRTTANFRDSLHAMFSNGVRLGLIEINPVTKAMRTSYRSGTISIFTLDQIPELLHAAVAHDCLAFVVLGLFAGLRRSEILRLTPVDFGPGWVRITKGKTRGSRRVVHLNDTARAWLPEDPATKLSTRQIDNLHDGLSFPWPTNGLRHSFASYHLAHFRDLNRLAADMGSSPGVIRREYAELVSPQDAAAFWRLRP